MTGTDNIIMHFLHDMTDISITNLDSEYLWYVLDASLINKAIHHLKTSWVVVVRFVASLWFD